MKRSTIIDGIRRDCTARIAAYRLVLFCCLGIVGTEALSQDPSPVPASPLPPPSATIPAEAGAPDANRPKPDAVTQLPNGKALSDVDADYVYIPGPDDRLIPIIASSKLEEFLKWLQQRNGPVADLQPDYGITELRITGEADDEHARLLIDVTLQLTVDRQWVRVPLNMHEAVIREAKYHGDGNAINQHREKAPAEQPPEYVWWFYGKGTHRLELQTLVPVVTQSPTRRMQLTLPNAAVGSMQLTVPFDRFAVKLPDEATSLVKKKEPRQIELVGLDSQLDIAWQPAPETQPVDLVLASAVTPIDLDFTGETVLLKATHKVRALQGTFDELTVWMPPDFGTPDVEGPSYRKHEFADENPRRVVVSLTEPTSGPIELTWTLQAPFPSKGIPLAIEGFQVEHAQRQTGEIQIRSFEGYRVRRREGEDRFIHQINVSDAGVEDRVSSAYRFLKQPFRLVLDVQKEEPRFLVTPEVLAHVTESDIDLQCRFRFQVIRGAVSSVVIKWPMAVQEGWVIDPLQTPGLIESVTTSEEEMPAEPRGEDNSATESRWHVKFVAPKTGTFEMTLNARRPIDSDGQSIACHLPTADASSQAPTVMAWILAENVESELEPIGMTTLRPVQSTVAAKVEIPAEWSSLRQMMWRIDSLEQALSVAVKRYPQRIDAETDVEAEIGEEQIAVRQRLMYDVAYERVAVLRMTVSQAVSPRPKFFIGGNPLTTIWNEETNSTVASARVELPEPRLKHFEIEARYSVPMDIPDEGGENAALPLPIVQSSDASFKSTRVSLQQQSIWEVDVAQPEWQSEIATEDALVFRATTPHSHVPLTIRRYQGERQRTLTIPRAVVRTQLSPNGSAMTRAQYRIEGSGREIDIQVPETLDIVGVWMGREELILEDPADKAAGMATYRIPLGRRLDGSSAPVLPVVLTLDLRSKSPAAFDWIDRHRIELPIVPEEYLVQQTVCEVILPGAQHLADYPAALSPQFTWQVTPRGWMRRPLPGWTEPEKWIGGGAVPPPLAGFDTGNRYVFSRFGAVDDVSVRTLHRSLLVLFGAGLSLVASAAWLNAPRVRHPYSLIGLALMMSVAALWYEAIVFLLLQPFVGGLLLAVLAFAIDRRYRREGAPAVVTLGSTNEYMVPLSSAYPPAQLPATSTSPSGSAAIAPGVGSEDPTTLRPAHASGQHRESISVAERGSRA